MAVFDIEDINKHKDETKLRNSFTINIIIYDLLV